MEILNYQKLQKSNETSIKIDKTCNNDNVLFMVQKLMISIHQIKLYIYTLNVCATQELYKIIQEQETIINDLMSRIIKLENQKFKYIKPDFIDLNILY